MFFMKKLFLGLGFLFLISLGGAGTQSNSLLMQGLGFFGIIIGLVILYVFGKMVWRVVGCFPSFLIISVIVLFMMYSFGMFNNGLSGVGDAILKFIGRETTSQASQNNVAPMPSVENNQPPAQDTFKPEFEDNKLKDDTQSGYVDATLFENMQSASDDVKQQTAPVQQQQGQVTSAGFIDNVLSAISGKQAPAQQPKQFNPNDYPVVYGSVRVVNADTLIMYGKYFKLFGIDAPESNQTCANKNGRSYNCGREAAMWLKNWIGENELECHVIRQNTKGDMEGTCSYGPYDLGAALVNAGWAVANVKITDIYYPYEVQAKENRRGLWQGQFYMPWDWRKMQNRKAKIKVVAPKKKNMFGI
ncbi:MAG: thermonuclease family protein [Alphaproteobacteria bacterium]|nr:thermonuclease family protein [Alphaproteobacteria bacterium]